MPETTLHRIREVRRREGVSVRTLAGRLKISGAMVKKLENPTTDIRLSDLYLVAETLKVPVAELICDSEHDTVQVLRALLVRVAVATNTLLGKCTTDSQRRLAEHIQAVVSEEIPAAECGTLPEVGQRRGPDELGRVACAVPTFGVTRLLAGDPTADTRRQR